MSTAPSIGEVQKSLKYSLWDGASWSLTVGFAEIYFSPFAIFLGAANVVLGILTTVPQLIGSLSQLLTERCVRRIGSRKRLVLAGICGQGGMLLLIGLTPLLGSHRLSWLFLSSTLYWICWMILTPAWQSWIAELVPAGTRGRYFGKRNRIIQMVTFAALVAAGGVLDISEHWEIPYLGFLLLFAVGFLGRFASFFFVRLQAEEIPKMGEGNRDGWGPWFRKIRQTDYGLFTLYISLFSMAVNMAVPYFVPYLLQELRFSYLEFMMMMAILVGCKFFFLPLWGRLSDRYGARKLLIIACLPFSLIPFLWMISGNIYYLAGVVFIAGLATGGYELCSFNYLLDCTTPEERTRDAARYQAAIGVGIVAGALMGGALLRYGPYPERPYETLFFVSGALRLILSLRLLPRIREKPH